MYLGLMVPTEGGACTLAPDTSQPSTPPVVTPAAPPAPTPIPAPLISTAVIPQNGSLVPTQPTPTYLPYGTSVTLADDSQGYADGNGGILTGPAPMPALPVSTAPSMALVAPTPPAAPAPAPADTALPMGGVSTSTALLIGGGFLALYFLTKKKRRT